jgi:hypothetical protein
MHYYVFHIALLKQAKTWILKYTVCCERIRKYIGRMNSRFRTHLLKMDAIERFQPNW